MGKGAFLTLNPVFFLSLIVADSLNFIHSFTNYLSIRISNSFKQCLVCKGCKQQINMLNLCEVLKEAHLCS